jgi:sn-glycerol 3-phosphate transport system substrate-binding protein
MKAPRRSRAWLIIVAAMTVLASACGGGDDDEGAGGDGGGGDLPPCPIDALDAASTDGPVEIVFWHAMTRANEETLVQLTDEFNDSQDRVQVSLVNQTSYDDLQQTYRAGLETGELPDVVQHQEIYLQQMIDTQSALPVQSCVDATDYDTSDFVERTLRYYEVEGVQWALPFNVSNPVLFYNRTAFTRAGLDPDDPPDTLEELRTAAQALKDAGFEAGMGLKLDGWHLEQFLALQGQTFVDNGNGREARATEVTFDSESGEEVFSFLADLVADGLAITSPRDGPGQFDNLLGIAGERWGMTIDSSATLGTIFELLQGGQYANVDPAVAAMPGRTDEGGVLVGGASLYISAREEEKQAAAWEYMTFLTSPESQSVWSAGTGYIPVRQSATELPEVQQRWAEVPGFQVAYEQLVEGAENDATAGAVMGDLFAVRSAIEGAETRMLLENQDPAEALADAAEAANAIIQDYNERIGA